MSAIVTDSLRRKLTTDLLTEINNASDSVEYYIGIGKSDTYNSTDTIITPIKSKREEVEARNNLQSVKKVAAASIVVPRYNWVSGTIYSAYDDAITGAVDGSDYPYYVVTESNQVYLCLQQSKNAAGGINTSTVKPDYTQSGEGATKAFQTSDGYRWKFLYTISATNTSSFLSAGFIPVEKVIWNAPGDSASLSLFALEQLTIQNTANPGQIVNVQVTEGGSGYTVAPSVVFRGNGTGAAATATISGGSVVKIEMNNESAALGQNYDYASITFTGGDGSGVTARPIISPKLGFGYDPRDDLKGTSLMLNLKPNGIENGDFIVDQDFRQITVLKDLTIYDSTALFTEETGRALKYMTTTGPASSFSIDKLLRGETTGAAAYIDDIDSNLIYYHQNENTGFIPFADGEGLTESDGLGSGVVDSANLHSIVDNFSGELLYIENRARIIRNAAQQEDIKIIITA